MLKTTCVLLFCTAAVCSAIASDLMADLGRAALRVAGDGHYPTLVLPPGYRLNVGDRVVYFFGHDLCPQDWMDNLRGTPPERGCTELNDMSLVAVTFEDRTKESWIVKRDRDRTYLIPVNGARVALPGK